MEGVRVVVVGPCKGLRGRFGSDGNVLYLDCGVSYTSAELPT